MSELKAYGMNDPEVGDEYEMYKVSDVDKVLAGKDAEIIRLTALIENYNRISGEIIGNANHQKYKRCLLMAKICENKLGTVVKPGWWNKWRKRWLAIDNIFKGVQK